MIASRRLPVRTINDAMRRHAAERPHDVFADFQLRGASHRLTFADLLTGSARYAAHCVGRGIGPGDVVIIILDHGPDLATSFCGVMELGAIPSFMPYATPKQDAAYYWTSHKKLFDRIDPKLIITFAANRDKFAAHCPEYLDRLLLTDAVSDAQAAAGVDIDPDQVALLQHSSGTTSLKKGVMLTHRTILDQVSTYADRLDFGPDDVVASWLPLYHDMGLIATLMMPLIVGARVVFLDPFEWVTRPETLLDVIETNRATFCWLPNFAFSHLARVVPAARTFDLSSMRAFINCSEPCKANTFRTFLQRFGAAGVREQALQVSYAMAENVFAVTQTDLSLPFTSLRADRAAFAQRDRIEEVSEPGDAIEFLSCGPAIANTQMRIAGKDGTVLDDGAVGEILIRGTSLFAGYHRLPEQTARKLRDGWYHTGDLGFLWRDHLYVTGRTDDLITVYGRNYYAHEIEDAVNDVPGVIPGRSVAIDVPAPELGTNQIVVMLETRDEGAAQALPRQVKTRVAAAMGLAINSVVVERPGTLAKTTSGKISRELNRLRYLNREGR
ncbi:MAG TPA: AMP-binding protein [Vineibacter sp.]|nr:AMP-binding protein [Vineibacter sp.]